MLRPALVALAVMLLAAPSFAGRGDRAVYREIGKASWYGPGFHGRRTASGEVFDQNALTAAHPELPFGRKLDLSRAAAKRLGMLEAGIALVRIEATAQPIEQAAGDSSAAARARTEGSGQPESRVAEKLLRQPIAERG
jgi:rare lipoprotein A